MEVSEGLGWPLRALDGGPLWPSEVLELLSKDLRWSTGVSTLSVLHWPREAVWSLWVANLGPWYSIWELGTDGG